MPQLKVKDAHIDLVLDSGIEIPAPSRYTQVLLEYVDKLRTGLPGIVSFSYKQNQQGEWVYKFEDSTRVWKQIVIPAAAIEDFEMTFDCPDSWELREFMPNRELRDHVFLLVLVAQLTKLEITFS